MGERERGESERREEKKKRKCVPSVKAGDWVAVNCKQQLQTQSKGYFSSSCSSPKTAAVAVPRNSASPSLHRTVAELFNRFSRARTMKARLPLCTVILQCLVLGRRRKERVSEWTYREAIRRPNVRQQKMTATRHEMMTSSIL